MLRSPLFLLDANAGRGFFNEERRKEKTFLLIHDFYHITMSECL